jgi:hypothetical protein
MARKNPQEFEFFLHVVSSRIEDFYFTDSSNEILQLRFRRRMPNLLGDFFALQIHQNIWINQLSRRAKIALLKYFVIELCVNFKFYLHQLLNSYSCSVRVSKFSLGGLRIANDSSERSIWISRESLSHGLYSDNLERTLEFKRQKNLFHYSAFLNLKPVPFREILLFIFGFRELNRIGTIPKSEFFTEVRWRAPSTNERQIEIFSDAEVRHGHAIVCRDELHLLKSYQFENFKRWPAPFLLKDENTSLILSCKNLIAVDEAMFCGVAENWFHFIVEVCTKIASCSEGSSVPLILPSNLPPQQYQAVRLLTGIDPIQLSNLDSIRVGKLMSCKDGISKSIDDYAYLRPELESIRLKILSAIQTSKNSPTKVFIRRRASLGRPLQNSKEVARLLNDRGFHSVDPERLTFREQVLLFSQAKVIVIESGAAFTNVLFCKQGTSIIELYPAVGGLYFWQGYSRMFNLTHYRVEGKRSILGSAGFRLDGYLIDVQGDLTPLLESIS